MAKHIKRSVIPIYLVGAVWLVFGLFLSLHRPLDYLLCTILSLGTFVLGKAIFPDKHYRLPGEEEEERQEQERKEQERKEQERKEQERKSQEREERARKRQEEENRRAQEEADRAKAKSTGNPELDQLILERDRALSEMRRLNDNIEDVVISRQIDCLEESTRNIIDHVVQNPQKLPQIRRFLNYFLPTTLKILNAYDRMDATGISGENIDATKARVEAMLGNVVQAFDRQLDALFHAEAMDISTDITVMENLLAQEGLSGKKQPKSHQGEDITLEL